MKTFLIAGTIVDTDDERQTIEDVTPAQVNSFLKNLDVGEEVEIEITSYGGSVSAGLAICNLLKQASAEGHKTTAHVIGLAASMASAIACACDTLKIDSNAFLMIHNPWSVVQGDADEIRKEADVLDKYRDALLAIYRSKFSTTDEVIKKMMDDETWIIGISAPMYNLECEVIPTEEPLRAAAFAKTMPHFIHVPKALKEIVMQNTNEEMKQADGDDTTVENQAEEATEEKSVDEVPQTETPVEETQQTETPADEMIAKAEADRRVSGMQSAMAKQIDALRKDYEARIEDFTIQLKTKDEELTKAMAEVTRLTDSLHDTSKELSNMTSAFEEKAAALDALNQRVNTPAETVDWRQLKGKAFFDWYAKTH